MNLEVVRPGHRTLDPHHALRRNERRRGLQVHRLRCHLERRQHGPDEPLRQRPGHQSRDPHDALRRDEAAGSSSPPTPAARGPPQTGTDEPGRQALAISPATPSTLYAGTMAAEVFKSTDSGGTWAAANRGLTTFVPPWPSIPRPPPRSTPGRHGRVFKSTDSGGTGPQSTRD